MSQDPITQGNIVVGIMCACDPTYVAPPGSGAVQEVSTPVEFAAAEVAVGLGRGAVVGAARLLGSAETVGTKGASGELTTVAGNSYLGNSTGSSASGGSARAAMNQQTQEQLGAVVNTSRTHGHCCEVDAINKAINAGDSVQGATMGPVQLNESGRVIPPCSTCRELMNALGIKY